MNHPKKKVTKTGVQKTNSQKAKMTPLGDRVLVKPKTDQIEKTPSGIYIPETVKKEKPEEGTVVAVGSGRYEDGKLVPMRVKVGDVVVFSKYGYDEITISDEEYFILKEENILAIIK